MRDRGTEPLASEMYRELKLKYTVIKLVCAILAGINLSLIWLLIRS